MVTNAATSMDACQLTTAAHSPDACRSIQGTLVGVGDSAPDVVLTRLDGTALRLSELRGKVVCLNFFATWCAPCRRELPALQTMWDQFRDNKDFTMLIVSRKESQETVTSFK